MELRDMVKLLEGYGFKGLTLVKKDGDSSTFKFQVEDSKKLKHLDRTVTSNGKVEVYQLPEIGKFGVSKANSMVRFVSFVGDTKVKTDDSHLGGTTVPPELSLAFEKAKVSKSLQVPFCKKLWIYFNQHKFSGRMHIPKLEVSKVPSFGKPRGANNPRGVHQAGNNYTPGIIWMADFMFNAREPFFLEIFLHEMCHQAVWELDHYHSKSAADGHGPKWGKWMTHVGLDPRRFDPTDDAEYSDTSTNLAKETELTEKFGKRVPADYFTGMRLVPTMFDPGSDVVANYKGRAIKGVLRKGPGNAVDFTFRTPNRDLNSLRWKIMPARVFYYPKEKK